MLKFIQEVFSDAGSGSFSRCGSAAIILFCLVWTSHVVYKTHQLPDMGGVSMFMSSGVGTLYGINKAGGIFAAIKGIPKE